MGQGISFDKISVLRNCFISGLWLHNKTRAPHAGANARLQLLLENSKTKEGDNYVKIRLTCPIGLDSLVDSKQLA